MNLKSPDLTAMVQNIVDFWDCIHATVNITTPDILHNVLSEAHHWQLCFYIAVETDVLF